MTSPSLPWDNGKAIQVTVVGDLMLDEYLEGDVHRISPEAPVPVHVVKKRTLTAGGAANVARNIQLVGGHASICGIWGDDATAHELNSILKREAINTKLVVTDSERPTVKKTRVTARAQQLVRIDWEKSHSISAALEKKMLERVAGHQFHALVLSDYAKGALTNNLVADLVKLGQERGVPVIIDPKGNDFSRYKGSFLVTPNRKEACEALGRDPQDSIPADELAAALQQRYGLRHVLVTLGAEGMFWMPEPGSSLKPLHLPAVAREVFDVSGAGDTVVGMMSLCLAAGGNFQEAMHIANAAAGRVVEKWGTQPILKTELHEALAGAPLPSASSKDKITTIKALKELIGPMGQRARKVVFTNGCFDILHAGHVAYLEKAKSRGDLLVVAVNTDDSVKRIKGPSRPVVQERYRLAMLAALGCVDYVVPFSEDTPLEVIQTLEPDILVKGADYAIKDIVGADFVMKRGGKVEQIEFVPGLSTTDLIRRIRQE